MSTVRKKNMSEQLLQYDNGFNKYQIIAVGNNIAKYVCHSFEKPK